VSWGFAGVDDKGNLACPSFEVL
jgi:hypothetical protein